MTLFSTKKIIRKRQQIGGCGKSDKCDRRVEDSFNRGLFLIMTAALLDEGYFLIRPTLAFW